MTRRTALTIAGLAAASALSLVAVTNAWFVNVDSTPEGDGVTSALVRYLPEEEQRSSEALLTYGNLISGGSVDLYGYPLILPGDSLLSSTYVSAGKQVTRTSIAREYKAGDSAGTVINTETHYYETDGVTSSITRTQTDRMEGPDTVSGWYLVDSGAAIDKPSLTGYSSSSSSCKEVTTSDDKSLTTTVSYYVTTYSPPASAVDAPSYEYRQTVTTKVYHDPALFSGGSESDWNASPARTVSTKETVLSPSWASVSAATPTVTRSSLVITDSQPSSFGGTEDAPVPIPLQIENLSTVDTQVRIALSVVLTDSKGENPVSLTLQNSGQNYYIGKALDTGKFIDLFTFVPYAEAGADYSWTYNGIESDGVWFLWDLTRTAADGSSTTAIPPIPSPAADAETGAVTPADSVVYRAVQKFFVAGEAHDPAIGSNEFQSAFNALYCTDSPIIQIRLRYYVRQSNYMEWSQFYRQDVQLTFADTATTETGGEG